MSRIRDNRNDTEFWYKKRQDMVLIWIDKIFTLAINRFKWLNLPTSVDERYLEEYLIRNGKMLFFKDDILDKFLTLKFTKEGTLDCYDNPIFRRAYANTNYQKVLNEKNSVIIYENYLRTPIYPKIAFYADMLSNFDMTIYQNLYGLRTPLIFATSQDERLTTENFQMKYDSFIPIIKVNGTHFDLENFKVLNMNVPNNIRELQEAKTRVYAELLEFLGIESIVYQKNERLLTQEINKSLGATNVFKRAGLNARKQACGQINEMFGLNIDCQYNTDLIDKLIEYNSLDDITIDTQQLNNTEKEVTNE